MNMPPDDRRLDVESEQRNNILVLKQLKYLSIRKTLEYIAHNFPTAIIRQ